MLASLKEKKRYLAFEVISNKPVTTFNFVSRAIWDACLSFLGEAGVGKAGLWLISEKWDSKKQRGILKVNNKSIDQIKTSLTLVKFIERENVIIKSLGVSGMLTKADNLYIKNTN